MPAGDEGRVPVPDPTVLTTAALFREIEHLRELLETKISEADVRYQQRYDGQTKALDAARVAADLAVQAALVAAEKAVSKAEVAAEKRYDTLNDKMDDFKNGTAVSIAAIQGQLAEYAGRGAGLSAGWGYLVGALGLVGTCIGVVLALTR
jgi:hypothetical protein